MGGPEQTGRDAGEKRGRDVNAGGAPAARETRRHHVGSWVEEQLRQDILDGRILVGSKLFSSSRLAACYSINKMTANRVVQRLVREGLLRVERGNGTFLNTPRAAGKAGILRHGHLPLTRDDPYGGIIREMRLVLQKNGYSCDVVGRDDDVSGRLTVYGPSFGRVTAANFDLLVGIGIMNREYYERLCWLQMPIVAIDFAPGLERVSSVSVDSFNAGYQAGRMLVENGHRRLLFVPIFRGSPFEGTLYRELDSYLHECGWRFALESLAPDATCAYLGPDVKASEALAEAIRKHFGAPAPPTAVFGTGALEVVLDALANAGLRVPRDVSVVWSMWGERADIVRGLDITRFRVAWKEMARAAAGIIEDYTQRRDGTVRHLLINARFHPGATVGKRPARRAATKR